MGQRIRNLGGVMARKDRYDIDPRVIKVQRGWNPRTDFTGEEELIQSIIENGVQVPLRVMRGGTGDSEILLIDGERRLRATMEAIKRGNAIKSVPCMFERTGINNTEALFLSLITNQGKPLEPLEEAEAYRRLRAWGLTVAEIARRVGRSENHVRNRLSLVDAAPVVREAVAGGTMGPTEAVKIVKQSKGNEKAQQSAVTKASQRTTRPRRSILQIIEERARKMDRDQLKAAIDLLQALLDEICEEPEEIIE